MGHFVEEPSAMFHAVRYSTKTSPELREAMERKVSELRRSGEEREVRVRKLREEYLIDAERLARLILDFQRTDTAIVSYSAQGDGGRDGVIPAGVIAHIVREREMMDSERAQVRKMELILRNMRDRESYIDGRSGEHRERMCLHSLSDDELEFLGF
ncbi:MAG: hypothetical protein EOO75_12700 [Myxococcales bacterium]|nr:MAG: hypothetical protein EOO75_12700 [Myxococcales bacterium]